MEESFETRREFIHKLAAATGAVVLMPLVSACSSKPETPTSMPTEETMKDSVEEEAKAIVDVTAVPNTPGEEWNPYAYNKARGNAGMIPETYLGDINSPDGFMKHLGKHFPYVPTLEGLTVPAGFIAIMWGDPAKGHAKHPNAPKDDSKEYIGHWYDWIKVRKATEGEAEELQSEYPDWPGTAEQQKGKYLVAGGGDITADSGKNTIYLAALPSDVKAGDTIRIHAHCLTHGEYVDFITVA